MFVPQWIIVSAGVIVFFAVMCIAYLLFPSVPVQAPTSSTATSTATSTPAKGTPTKPSPSKPSTSVPKPGSSTKPNPSKDDLIYVTSLKAGDTISSPLVIEGAARGNWYFEASFPYEIEEVGGEVLVRGPVQAYGEWMTTEYVPFIVTIDYPEPVSGTKGNVILRKSNASGLPKYDDELIIPIVFR